MNTAQDTFVVISDDAQLIETVRAAVGAAALVQVATELEQALPLVTTPPAVGVIIDGALLKGSVIAPLSKLRAASPLVSIMFVASELRPNLLNDIQPLRIDLLVRPLPSDAVERFVRRTLSAGRLSELKMLAWIDHLASEHKLTGNDVALFPLVLDRETPEHLCARLNIDQEALSRGLRRLVKKCRVRNTDRLAKNVMRDALLFGSRGAVMMQASA
jgi:DNA-binding NarL/FixJ family response regulator